MRTTFEPIALSCPSLGSDELAAAAAVLASGRLVQGPEVAAFEGEFSELVNGRTCVAVSSGTSALVIALSALGLGPGDEVILPSFTFAATANAVRLVGATPVFADVRSSDFALDPDDVAARVTSRTSAVITVHLFGQTGDMTGLATTCRNRGLALVEDAAQAHGARFGDAPVGTFGAAAAFSFYATKNMTTGGEGGMVVLPDDATVRIARMLRNQGGVVAHQQETVGYNARMTEMAAAIGRVQLRRLPEFNQARRRHASTYAGLLAGLALPRELPGRTHVWHQYTLRVEDRDAAAQALAAAGVATGAFYRTPVHLLPAFRADLELPVTTELARTVLSLPVHPGLASADLEWVARVLLAR